MQKGDTPRNGEARTEYVTHQRATANPGVDRLAAGRFPCEGISRAAIRPAAGFEQRAGHDFGIARISRDAMHSNQAGAVQPATHDGRQKHIERHHGKFRQRRIHRVGQGQNIRDLREIRVQPRPERALDRFRRDFT